MHFSKSQKQAKPAASNAMIKNVPPMVFALVNWIEVCNKDSLIFPVLLVRLIKH